MRRDGRSSRNKRLPLCERLAAGTARFLRKARLRNVLLRKTNLLNYIWDFRAIESPAKIAGRGDRHFNPLASPLNPTSFHALAQLSTVRHPTDARISPFSPPGPFSFKATEPIRVRPFTARNETNRARINGNRSLTARTTSGAYKCSRSGLKTFASS